MRFRLRDCHPLWPDFPDRSAIARSTTSRSRNPPVQAPVFRLFRVRSPLLTESRLFSLPQGTEMFHFPWCRSEALCIQTPVMPQTGIGLPHSEIPGSKCVCHSPRLIAAYHVLHRLLMPRHSSCALFFLTENPARSSTVSRRPCRCRHHGRSSSRRAAAPLFPKARRKVACPSLCSCQRTIFITRMKRES